MIAPALSQKLHTFSRPFSVRFQGSNAFGWFWIVLTLIKENHCPGYYASYMAKKFPIHPIHPERVCWGCDKYCPTDSLACGNGSVRTQHPVELFGDDWQEWGLDSKNDAGSAPK